MKNIMAAVIGISLAALIYMAAAFAGVVNNPFG